MPTPRQLEKAGDAAGARRELAATERMYRRQGLPQMEASAKRAGLSLHAYTARHNQERARFGAAPEQCMCPKCDGDHGEEQPAVAPEYSNPGATRGAPLDSYAASREYRAAAAPARAVFYGINTYALD
jgi:hypothetical protein